MREIKFRAWDDYKREMIPVKGIRQYPTGGWSAWDGETEVLPCNVILMQFTGLLDKNGKEIWEGDILSTPAGYGYVQYLNGAWYLCWPDGGDTTLHGCPLERLEVIGNIYENPELTMGSEWRKYG